jgi:hypothetical protein
MKRLILAVILSAAVAAAAGIDGQWTSEIAARTPKKGAKAGAPGKPIELRFDLKSEGGQLTGTVRGGAGKRTAAMTIQDGKMDGDNFSFTTVQKTKNGENKWQWRGTVKGDELTGTRTRDGARRGQSFTAKRAG